MTSLNEDRDLLGSFIKWVTGRPSPIPSSRLKVLEQSLPDEEEPQADEEMERRGLPDGCIHDSNGWALLIESKIAAPLDSGQLQRHRRTAEKRGFPDLNLLAFVTDIPNRLVANDVVIKKWTELYTWLKNQPKGSKWANRLIAYMEILEIKLSNEGYLKEGTLTVFTGIPFDEETPYSYFEAKRILRLAIDQLRARNDLQQELEIDGDRLGRVAITGRDSPAVWDFLWLRKAKDTENFTEYPHPGLGIHREHLHALLIVPNGIRTEFRRNLLDGGIDEFRALFESVLAGFSKSLGGVEGAIPWVEIIQRRYPSQRSEPFIDAKLEFDLRTGFDPSYRWDKSAKKQTEWLEATYHALSNRSSNLQLAVGAKFPYRQCRGAKEPAILDHIANAWLACKPLLRKMIP
jgi:hypothetical protein